MSKPIKYCWISNYFQEDPSCISRGRIFLSSNKLREFAFETVGEHGYIKASVESSYRPNVLHQVKVSFQRQSDRGFSNAYCDCVRGNVLCSHLACVMLHAEKTISKTDVPVSESLPRTCHTNIPSEILFEKANNCTSLHSTQSQLTNGIEVYRLLASKIVETSAPMKHSLYAILTPFANPTNHVSLPRYKPIEDIIAAHRGRDNNFTQYFKVNIKPSADDIAEVEKATRGQASNPLWKSYRFGRITASRCKQAIVAANRKTNCVSESYLNVLLHKTREIVCIVESHFTIIISFYIENK